MSETYNDNERKTTRPPFTVRAGSQSDAIWLPVEMDLLRAKANGKEEDVKFPIDVFRGLRCCAMINAIAIAEQLPWSMVCVTMLSAISAAIGKGLRLRVQRISWANLYIVVVGESGVGKSRVMQEVMKPILILQNRLNQEWRKSKMPALNAEERKLKLQLAELDMKKDTTPEMVKIQARLDEIAKLKTQSKRLLVEDVTSESLGVLLEQNNETLSLVSSDGRAVVDNLCGRYQSSGQSDEALLVKAWSGDPHYTDRIKRGSVELKKPWLNMVLLIQPDKADKLFGNAVLLDGGLVPRLLMTRWSGKAVKLAGKKFVPISWQIRQEYETMIHELADTYLLRTGSSGLVESSQAAQALWVVFHDFCVDIQEGITARFAPLVSRWAEQATRIALILHVAKHGVQAEDHELSEATMKAAIRVTCYFCGKQLDMLAVQLQQAKNQRLEKLVNLLRVREGKETVSKLVKSHGFRREELVQLAEEFNDVLQIQKLPSGSKGGKPSTVVKLIKDPYSVTDG